MRIHSLGVMALIALLAGCGGRNEDALAACEAAIAERMDGKRYRLDSQAFAASAREESGQVLVLTGEVVIDPGLSGEQRQSVECKTRFVAGQARPDVISLNFVWQ